MCLNREEYQSSMQAATVWINRISDFFSSQRENPNNLDCIVSKSVWFINKIVALRSKRITKLFYKDIDIKKIMIII